MIDRILAAEELHDDAESPDTRDRVANPSINFPESADEALRAVAKATAKHVAVGSSFVNSPLYFRTRDAGFGMERTQEQTDWLNDAVIRVSTQLSDTLREIGR